MKVSVFGLGYVGALTVGCLANDGHDVIGVDVNEQKLRKLAAGQSPVIEPGLDEMLSKAAADGRLKVTSNAEEAVLATDISLVCVGTPSNGNGSLDTKYVEKVCFEIGRALGKKGTYHVIVIRSTVLPSTVNEILIPLLESQSECKAGDDFGVSMNPEFLREGMGVKDFYHPSYVIIGELDKRSGDTVEKLYTTVDAPVVRTSLKTAEMVKYASNAFHALKIAFANEIGSLSKALGVDGQDVMDIIVKDTRLNISPAYMRPGYAFGGSCLPKDLRAMVYKGKQKDIELPVLSAALQSNELHIQRSIKMVEQTGGKKIGVLGLSFKAGTDDVRESPVIPLIETLLGRGYEVTVYDDTVHPDMLIGANKSFLERELPHIASIMRRSVEDMIKENDVVVITNNSKTFQNVPHMMRKDQHLIDFTGVAKNSNGTIYHGIGW